MPFTAPQPGQGTWWRQIESLHEGLFVCQERRFWRSVFRIILSPNTHSIALTTTRDEILADWERLKTLCDQNSELAELLGQRKQLASDEFLSKLMDFFTRFSQVDAPKLQAQEEEEEEDEVNELEFEDYPDPDDLDLQSSIEMSEEDPMSEALNRITMAAQDPTGESSTEPSPTMTEGAEPRKVTKKKRLRSTSATAAANRKKIVAAGTMILLTELKKPNAEGSTEGSSERTYDRVEGWLAKQAVSQVRTSPVGAKWQNRYFVMERGCLFYYEIIHIGDYSLANLKIDDSASTLPVSLMGVSKMGYSMSITTDNVSLLIAASTEAELNSWKLALHNQFPEDETQKNSLVISPVDEEEKVPEKRGWLFVQLPNNQKWKFCFAIVRNQTLDIGEAFERGFFPMQGSNIEITSEVSFLLSSALKGFLHLCAASSEVMEQWIINMKRAIAASESNESQPTTATTAAPAADDREAIRLMHLVQDILEMDEKRKQRSSSVLSKPAAIPSPTPSLSTTPTSSMFSQFSVSPSSYSSTPFISALVPSSSKRTTLNILSLDGGGLRGIMNTIIISRLMEEFPDLLSRFDFFAGTSNGAMVATGLAFGFSPLAIRHLIELTGKIVFVKDNTTSYLATPLSAAKFSNVYLKLLCEQAWGKNRIKDAPKYLMIPAFLLDNKAESPEKRSWETRLFHNLTDGPEGEDLASDVVMRTAAAPTYFPSYQTYVDGGMFAHDPASSAVTLAMSRLGKKPDEIRVLSMGTGRVMKFIDSDTHNWGMYQWVPYLSSVLWDGMISQSEFMCREFLGPRYHRLNPVLKTDIAMDDPEQIPVLTQVAKSIDLTATIKWVRENIYGEEPPATSGGAGGAPTGGNGGFGGFVFGGSTTTTPTPSPPRSRETSLSQDQDDEPSIDSDDPLAAAAGVSASIPIPIPSKKN